MTDVLEKVKIRISNVSKINSNKKMEDAKEYRHATYDNHKLLGIKTTGTH